MGQCLISRSNKSVTITSEHKSGNYNVNGTRTVESWSFTKGQYFCITATTSWSYGGIRGANFSYSGDANIFSVANVPNNDYNAQFSACAIFGKAEDTVVVTLTFKASGSGGTNPYDVYCHCW